MDDLIEEFITETSAALAQIEPHLTALKQPGQPVPPQAYELVRAVKSASGFLGLPRLETLARAGESLLGGLRSAAPDTQQSTLVLALFERLDSLVNGLAASGAEPRGDDTALIKKLTDAAPATSAPMTAAITPPKPQVKKAKAKPAAKKKKPTIIDAPRATPASESKSAQALKSSHTHTTQAIAQPSAAASKPATTSSKKASAGTAERIHIQREAFEQLLQLVAQMVQARNHLLHTAPSSVSPEFHEALAQMSQLVTTLKDGMLSNQVGTNPASLPAAPKIISSFILTVGAQRFAIAREGVSGLVRIGGESGYTVEANNMLRLRDRMVPLTALSDMLGVRPQQKPGNGYVAILRIGTAEIGIVADSIAEGEELVVQPLSRALARLNAFAGSAITGDGRVVLVIEPNTLARAAGERALLAHQSTPKQPKQHLSTQGQQRPPSFLIFSVGGSLKAVPLERILRLETVNAADITLAPQGGSMPYRGETLELRGAPGMRVPTQGPLQVIILRHGEETLGLLADKIMDILMTPLEIGLGHRLDGYLGSAMIAGEPTDIVDVDALFAQEDA